MRSVSLFAVLALVFVLAASSFSPVAAFTGIRIHKVTTNGDTTTIFHFTVSDETAEEFDLVGDEMYPIIQNTPGPYVVKEKVPAGWVLTDVSCVAGSQGSTFTYMSDGVIVHYIGEDTVDCTFLRTPLHWFRRGSPSSP